MATILQNNPLSGEIATLMMHIDRSRATRGAPTRAPSCGEAPPHVHNRIIDGQQDHLPFSNLGTTTPDNIYHQDEHGEGKDERPEAGENETTSSGDPVTDWLFEIGLDQYAVSFAENDLNPEAIANLTKTDFDRLGVRLGHRRVIIDTRHMLVPQKKLIHWSQAVPLNRNDIADPEASAQLLMNPADNGLPSVNQDADVSLANFGEANVEWNNPLFDNTTAFTGEPGTQTNIISPLNLTLKEPLYSHPFSAEGSDTESVASTTYAATPDLKKNESELLHQTENKTAEGGVFRLADVLNGNNMNEHIVPDNTNNDVNELNEHVDNAEEEKKQNSEHLDVCDEQKNQSDSEIILESCKSLDGAEDTLTQLDSPQSSIPLVQPLSSQVSTARSFRSEASSKKYFLCFTCYTRKEDCFAVRSKEGDQLFCSEKCNSKHEKALEEQRARVRSAIEKRMHVGEAGASTVTSP